LPYKEVVVVLEEQLEEVVVDQEEVVVDQEEVVAEQEPS
jgi:hypothetical protein